MRTIDDVARAAGVSTSTVSRALSGRAPVAKATRQRVLTAVEDLEYVVSPNASGLATGNTRNVGIVVPFLTRWFYTEVIAGAQAALIGHGYDLTLYNLQGDGLRREVFESFLTRRRVDAVLAVALKLTDVEAKRLTNMKKPTVGIGGPISGVPTLSIDDIAVAELATDHLISLGHTVIGHIGGDEESDFDFHVPSHRYDGYKSALRRAGIALDPELYVQSDFTLEGGHQAATQLLNHPHRRPTAIFAASDEMAIGAILAARDAGLQVPAELSVIGVDGHPLGSFFGLTTLDQHPHRQGSQAADLLIGALDNNITDAPDIAAEVDLVIRASTAPPPAFES